MQRPLRIPMALVVALASVLLFLAPVAASAEAAVPRHTFARLVSAETTTDDVFVVRGRLTSAPGRAVALWSRAAGTTTWRQRKAVTSDPGSGAFRMTFRGSCGARFRIAVRATPERSRTVVYIGRIVCE